MEPMRIVIQPGGVWGAAFNELCAEIRCFLINWITFPLQGFHHKEITECDFRFTLICFSDFFTLYF